MRGLERSLQAQASWDQAVPSIHPSIPPAIHPSTMDPLQESLAWGTVFTSGYVQVWLFLPYSKKEPIKCVSKPVMRELMRYMRDHFQDIRMRHPSVQAAQIWFDPPRFRHHLGPG